jgi:hypothetical protein
LGSALASIFWACRVEELARNGRDERARLVSAEKDLIRS